MRESEFNRLIVTVVNGRRAGKGQFGTPESRRHYETMGQLALETLEREFLDEDKNIQRWLAGKPCVYRNHRTGKPIDIQIGGDTEAMWYFLSYCKKRRLREEIDDSFFDYMALLITRSNSKELWEEC